MTPLHVISHILLAAAAGQGGVAAAVADWHRPASGDSRALVVSSDNENEAALSNDGDMVSLLQTQHVLAAGG
eukprot:CAMPEP_0204517674 /NCGR_PEP_ID=MMETSP0661-20131031/3796_1 /ASSEMBLY_ACC=CAM_ASM_000606 /TAXON_ID=109239 /ORGANISM="Alexandrium margalefi, Strain AMGDE01CS-322" /LENGTH=71 /DNA_ID=CAMNT_0051523083 /DNA_START=39 /DNA_END=251 /DNA_ORIENTATION=-